MPRQARSTPATSVYHATLRGVNKQQVIEDEEDYMRFLYVLHWQTQPDVDEQGQPVYRRVCASHDAYIYYLSTRKALDHALSHDSQAFHTPLFTGLQVGRSVVAEW